MQNYNMHISGKTVNLNKKYFLIFSYALSITIAVIVYMSGGTNKVYANFMYLPITIIAIAYGKKQAVFCAVTCGLLVGPFMPLEVSSNVMQQPINWIVRLIIYSMIAFIVGVFAEYDKKEFEKIIKAEKDLAEAQIAMVYAMMKLAEFRDGDTGMHIERVVALSKHLACKLREIPKYQDYINDDYIENIKRASPLHDIGKVAIPDKILLKKGKLLPNEFEIMKTHTTIGAKILEEVDREYPNYGFINIAINIARYHHEKWDGTGYPYALTGETIPLSARIMALVDVYDALRSKRIYKKPYSHEKSLEIIKQSEGLHFDPEFVNIFIKYESEFRSIYEMDRLPI